MRPVILLFLALAAAAQKPEQVAKFSVTSKLVVVNVAVRDRSGRAVEGLKAGDFIVLEDDKPQKIAVFEYEKLDNTPSKKPMIAPPAAAPVPRKEITPSAPGQLRYKDRRLMVLFFDMSSMGPAEQAKAKLASMTFLGKNMTTSDVVAIMLFSSSLQVLQDFTDDRAVLYQGIRSIKVGEGSELAGDAAAGEDDEVAEDNGSAFTADETEFNIFNTDRKLSALESAVKLLGSMPEKKALVYFSSGVGKTGVENQSQLRATINAAVRSNVSFYTIDARGLMAFAPAGDASHGSPKGAGIYSGAMQRQQRDRFVDQQETLFSLAADTGGKALLDSNDLTAGIVQAQKDISSYYVLGYYSTNAEQDGRFRRIRVRMDASPSAKLDYRSGYFAPKDFRAYSSSDRERQLEEALLLGDPMTDLTLAVEVNYFRRGRGNYFVPVALKIPGSQIELARKGGNELADLDFVAQVRDKTGKIAGGVRDNIKVKLGEEKAGQLAQRQLEYDSGFTLAPGEYTLKFLARENATGKMGTFETKFTVPDLSSENAWLRLSSVVLANQRELLASALGSAEAANKAAAAHPLVQGGRKLVPSITRVFRKNQELYVYFEVYDSRPQITASLSFFRGKVKAFESEVLHMTGNSGQIPVRFEVPLASLAPGKYTCQVNVIDEQGEKFAFDRAPMVVLK